MEMLLTVDEVSKILKVSQVWIYKLVREKKIPFCRLGGKTVRFKQSELETWIETGRDQRYCRDKWREAEIQG